MEAPNQGSIVVASSDGGNVKLFTGNRRAVLPAAASIAVRPEKILEVAEKNNSNSTSSTSFPCHLCDKHLIDVIAQELLTGLATACVDSTRGNLFKSPSSVAGEIRKAMLKYLGTRSQYFVAESILLDEDKAARESMATSEGLDDPFDIISGFLNDFAHLNRNLFSMVPGWLLSEKRLSRIDDFLHELKETNFWEIEMRETVAQVLLMNVDFMNFFHCTMTFGEVEELERHQKECGFRPVMCGNEGCVETFSADHHEHHDLMCPFKVLPCEQGCAEQMLRHDMERHCDILCPMNESASIPPPPYESTLVESGDHHNTHTSSLMDPVSPPKPIADSGFPTDLASASVAVSPSLANQQEPVTILPQPEDHTTAPAPVSPLQQSTLFTADHTTSPAAVSPLQQSTLFTADHTTAPAAVSPLQQITTLFTKEHTTPPAPVSPLQQTTKEHTTPPAPISPLQQATLFTKEHTTAPAPVSPLHQAQPEFVSQPLGEEDTTSTIELN